GTCRPSTGDRRGSGLAELPEGRAAALEQGAHSKFLGDLLRFVDVPRRGRAIAALKRQLAPDEPRPALPRAFAVPFRKLERLPQMGLHQLDVAEVEVRRGQRRVLERALDVDLRLLLDVDRLLDEGNRRSRSAGEHIRAPEVLEGID